MSDTHAILHNTGLRAHVLSPASADQITTDGLHFTALHFWYMVQSGSEHPYNVTIVYLGICSPQTPLGAQRTVGCKPTKHSPEEATVYLGRIEP